MIEFARNNQDITLKTRVLEIVIQQNQILLKNHKKGIGVMTHTTNNNYLLKSIFAVSLIVIATVFSFAACGGGTSVLGEWKLDRVVKNGVTVKANDTDKKEFSKDFENLLVFNKDKKGTIKINPNSDTACTWKQTNMTITVTAQEKDTTFELRGEELIYQKEGTRYFYKKSKK